MARISKILLWEDVIYLSMSMCSSKNGCIPNMMRLRGCVMATIILYEKLAAKSSMIFIYLTQGTRIDVQSWWIDIWGMNNRN